MFSKREKHMPRFNPSASYAYMKSIGGGRELSVLTPELIAEIEAIRHEVRADYGGGGMCHVVTEILQDKYGWERLCVSYLTPEGEIICGGGHVVSVMRDGSILDPTRDQFGEGFSVSLIPAGSPELGRYRPEFYEDFHPHHPDASGHLDGWADCYDGRLDADVQDINDEERGEGWWLSDLTNMEAYNARQTEYRNSEALRPA